MATGGPPIPKNPFPVPAISPNMAPAPAVGRIWILSLNLTVKILIAMSALPRISCKLRCGREIDPSVTRIPAVSETISIGSMVFQSIYRQYFTVRIVVLAMAIT